MEASYSTKRRKIRKRVENDIFEFSGNSSTHDERNQNNVIFDEMDENEVAYDENDVAHDETDDSHYETEIAYDENDVSHDENDAAYNENDVSHDENDVVHDENDVSHDTNDADYDENDVSHDENDFAHDENDVANDENDFSQEMSSENDITHDENNENSDMENEVLSPDTEADIEEDIVEWATEFNIPMQALSSLLTILQPHFPNLPKDSRTLLRTKTAFETFDVSGGSYHYLGIKAALVKLLESQETFRNLEEIKLQANVDGMPLFKSTSDQLWPILCRISNYTMAEPFVVALYYGRTKPLNIHEYLQDFKDELQSLQIHGLQWQNESYSVTLDTFMCDTPARSFVKCTKGHNGYHGCDKCTTEGEWLGKICYPETDAPLRTNTSFDEMIDEDHHHQRSPLSDVIPMVSSFPLDYMHLVCLGVVKRLIWLWVKGPVANRLPGSVINALSDRLERLRNSVPKEFARRPRSILEFERWKATEFRQFLLYTGPAVLKSLDTAVYQNFMLLSVAIHLLINPHTFRSHNEFAKELLVAFVQHFGKLYGSNMVVYNIHGLIHLPADALLHGNLDEISCFPFENYLAKLKRVVRKPTAPLQQILRRLSEKRFKPFKPTKETCMKQKDGEIVPPGFEGCIQFKSAQVGDYQVTRNSPDGWVIRQPDKVVSISNIVQDEDRFYVVGEEFQQSGNLFDYPIDSSQMGIRLVSKLPTTNTVFPIEEATMKCLSLPYQDDQYVIIPLTKVQW